MQFKSIFTVLALSFLVNGLYAQELTKKEKRALKKEVRAYIKEPVKYQYLKESLATKDVIVKEQSTEINDLTSAKDGLVKSLVAARDTIELLKNEIAEAKSTEASTGQLVNSDGLKYRVQIGLYKEFDIRSFLNDMKVTSFEETEGLFRYTIGNFTTEEEAETFKLAVRKMGIKDAFVSHYLDGQRIPKNN